MRGIVQNSRRAARPVSARHPRAEHSGTVPAGTTLTVIPGLTPNTLHYVWVRSICGPGEFGEWSTSATFTTLPAPPVYCTPVGSSVDGTGLTNVTFSSINNTTGNEAATNFYGNYSGLTANIAQGANVPISMTFSTSIFDYFVSIWIDWNNDGDFIDPGEEVYAGQIIAENIKPGDLVVNATEPKKLTNHRASGTDDATRMAPKTLMTLEECMEYIQFDECIEVTPNFIRMRKVILDEEERKKQSKSMNAQMA